MNNLENRMNANAKDLKKQYQVHRILIKYSGCYYLLEASFVVNKMISIKVNE